MTTTDWGALYQQGVAALLSSRGQLAEHAEQRVPATPGWTVRQVLAHLVGTPADALAGRMDGAPGAEWTARHVAEREGDDVPALLTELDRIAPAFAAVVDETPAAVFNLLVHHADLLEALGDPRQDESLWRPVVEALRSRWAGAGLAIAGDAGAADGAVPVDGYPLYRALFSRLTRAELAAVTGGALGDEQLDRLGLFGPPPA